MSSAVAAVAFLGNLVSIYIQHRAPSFVGRYFYAPKVFGWGQKLILNTHTHKEIESQMEMEMEREREREEKS